MNKKGAELSMNVIIISIIALVVLVIVIIVFVQNFYRVVPEVNSCVNKGGRCVESRADCTGEYERIQETAGYVCPGRDLKDPKDNEYCCVGLNIQQ